MVSEVISPTSTAAASPTATTGPESSPAPVAAPEASPAASTAAPAAPGDGNGSQGFSLDSLTDEQFQQFLRHPKALDYIDRKAQAQKDKELARHYQQWETQQRAAQEAEARRREREQIKADPVAYAERLQQRIEQEDAAEPLVDQALTYGMSQGEKRAWGNVRSRLDKFKEWAGMPEETKLEWINTSQEPGDLFERVVEHIAESRSEAKAAKKAEAELSKFRQSAEREERAKQRQQEPSPDVGEGAAPAGRLSESEYKANRHSSAWVQRNMERLKEAASRGWA